jgi:phosphopantothenoylcysteine decarboxylase/phosphopantothenate--cysteine ligase
MHPSESLRGSRSNLLSGKRIVLGITGSIAAVECFELARELIRHGAEVHAAMSESALDLMTPWTMEFATAHEVIDVLDGRAQHVALLGEVPGRADLLLIAPCTANTLSKIANGIDDTTVTTMATIAVGSHVPILIAPAMHLAMYQNAIVQRNLQTLKDLGIGFVGPRVEDEKAKVAGVPEIVSAVIRRIGRRDYLGHRVLVIGGSSEEKIDEMRVITNRGTGETAIQLALAAYHRGAEVELWMGRCSFPLPGYITTRRFATVDDLLRMVGEIDHEVVIVPAALSDYTIRPIQGKIPSGKEELVLRLSPTPKVLDAIRRKECKLIGFKAEYDVGEKELVKRAKARRSSVPLELIVANDLKDVVPGGTKALLIGKKRSAKPFAGTKGELADRILDEVLALDR